uniref:Inhibitor of growth protein n=1 Tax=Aceria tosichella TaxID=561515 RepID=A0A6G1SL50_9ACAR
MANWLLDYIEMTEYIPPEFRDQSFSMRELDLKVSIAMSQLENDIREFFSKIESLNPKEKQEQYEALVKKCDEASMVANTKVKIADRLHDLVEKSMRLLDQGLEKLKEDLIEGDKAYIVEDIERRSQELDDQLHLEEETMMQRQNKIRDSKTSNNHHHHHSKGSHVNNINNTTSDHRLSNHHVNHNNHYSTQISHHNHHHHNNNNSHHNHHHHNRHRNNSTGAQNSSTTSTTTPAPGVKQKKRERKRLNSAMTIFNRNSKTDDDSTNQTNFLSSPTTPDYLANLHSSNSNSLNDMSGGDTSSLTLKGMAGNRISIGANDKSNGTDPLAKARQPILTAIDAAHAVSPNATNSDKSVLFSNNSNGDNYNNSKYIQDKHIFHHQNQSSQLGNHIISPADLMNSGHNLSNINGNNKSLKGDSTHPNRGPSGTSSPFSSLSRHDPIMMAASQAIHATQNMTPGRRTSSLKASYAAVNSGRLHHPNQSNHSMFDQANLTGEVYCKCRGTVHDPMMIACDNVKCKIEWFHYECVGITTPPPGEWYCDDCKGLPRTVQEQAANTSKHQQSRQAANNLLQAADTMHRGETKS